MWSNMKMSNSPAKYEVLIKQYLPSILDISDRRESLTKGSFTYTPPPNKRTKFHCLSYGVFIPELFSFCLKFIGINGLSSLTNYKQTTAEPPHQTPIKPSSTIISTVNTSLHTPQFKEYDDRSNISVASSSDANLVQVSHSSTQGSLWSNRGTFQEDSTPLIEASTTGITTAVLKDTFANQKIETSATATTVVNHTVLSLPTKTVVRTTWSSSSSSSLPPMTIFSHASVAIKESSLQTTRQSVTGRSVSDYQDRQTGTISIDISSAIIFGSTVSLKSASLINMISHSSKSVLSPYTSRGSNTLVSKQEDRSSSEMHVTIASTDGTGIGSKTQTARHNFTNGMSLRTTITHGSLTKTIFPSFHIKGSKESFSVTPMVGKSSTFSLPSGRNGSFDLSALPGLTKGSESLQTYPRTVAFSMSVTTSVRKTQLNTSYNMSAASGTLNLAQTLKPSAKRSLPTSHGNATTSFALSITSPTNTINFSGVLSVILPTTGSVATFSTVGSSLPPASIIPSVSYSVTKISLISKMYQAKTSSKLFLSGNASGSIVISISQTEKNIISGSPTVSMESPSRMIKDSTSEGSVKDASITLNQNLPATINSPFSSTIKEAMVRINTSNIKSIGSEFDSSLDTFAPGSSISNIKSTMFQISFGVSTYPFASSLTAASLRFSVKASNISTSLTASTAGSGSRLQSLTLTEALSSAPFIVNPSVSETSVVVLTTQKPSKGVSVTMLIKSSTHASVRQVSSPSTGTNLSSAEEQTSSILIFGTSSHTIKPTEFPFRSVSTSTLPGNSVWTLDRIQTPSSPSLGTPPLTSRTTSSIDLDTIKTFGTATSALVATVSVSTQTGPQPVSPKHFDVSMVLQMPWKSHYEYSYTPEFQALASKVKTQVTTVLIAIDGFLSLEVSRFWKSSVGVDLVVFVKQGAEVGEDTVERTLIEANNTGVLNLPLTSIQVQQRETRTKTTLPATQSPNEDKSIERWIIILIVAGILVFLMSLIICCLLVSKLTPKTQVLP